MIRYLFGALGLVAFIGAVYQPKASAQFPNGTCVIEAVSSGGNLTYTCENRRKFDPLPTPLPTVFTGIPCTLPAAGIVLYAKLPDNTCLPIEAVAAFGFTATNVTTWSQIALNGTKVATTTYVRMVPNPAP